MNVEVVADGAVAGIEADGPFRLHFHSLRDRSDPHAEVLRGGSGDRKVQIGDVDRFKPVFGRGQLIAWPRRDPRNLVRPIVSRLRREDRASSSVNQLDIHIGNRAATLICDYARERRHNILRGRGHEHYGQQKSERNSEQRDDRHKFFRHKIPRQGCMDNKLALAIVLP